MYTGLQGGLSVLPRMGIPSGNRGMINVSPLETMEIGEPKKKKKPTEEELRSFGTIGGTADVRGKTAYLAKKGLQGASQMLMDKPDLSTKSGIVNSQADWKTAAMELMLSKSRELGLRTPNEVAANREALLGSLPPRMRDAIKNPVFGQIHKNWWEVFDSVLKDQYDAEAVK